MNLARIVLDVENVMKLEQVTEEMVMLLGTHGVRAAKAQVQRPAAEPVTVYDNPIPDGDRGLAEGDPDS